MTGVGPGTVEQFTADVARLSRAYVSGAPLPLFAVMHHELALVPGALDRASAGMGAMRLHAIHARALAADGDRALARAAITAAGSARADGRRDELHDGVGGEFAFDDAKLSYYQALTELDVEDPAQAERSAAEDRSPTR